jgi:heat shock protein HtpX
MNLIKTTCLLTCLTLLLVAMGSAIGGQSGMLIAFAIACGMNLFSCWYSDKIILKRYKAREVSELDSPAVYGMVRRLRRAGDWSNNPREREMTA